MWLYCSSICCSYHMHYPCSADMWSFPATTGERPPACAGFSLTSIDHRRAVMFGGDGVKCVMNDVYVIDLQTMVC